MKNGFVALTTDRFIALSTAASSSPGSSWQTRLGDPTPLGVASFIVAHTPQAFYLLGAGGTSSSSGVAVVGAFYACAGIGLYIASILEFIVGDTFHSVIFGSFGGYWIAYAVLITPSMGIAKALPADGVQYNAALGLYFATWTVLAMIYFIASIRVSASLAGLFAALVATLITISAGHFHAANGSLSLAAKEFKVAGGLALIVTVLAFWIVSSLLFTAVGYQTKLPTGDLTKLRWLQEKKHRNGDEAV